MLLLTLAEYRLLAVSSLFVNVDPVRLPGFPGDLAIAPLAIPLLAGPGAISTVIPLHDRADTVAQNVSARAAIRSVPNALPDLKPGPLKPPV